MLLDSNALSLLVILISIVISLSIHEAMHAFISLKLGDTTAYDQGRVSFNPFRHIDLFSTVLLPIITLVLFGVPLLAAKPVPFNPLRVKFEEFGAAMVAAAGPLTNLLLAALGSFIAGFFSSSSVPYNVLAIFTVLNVAVFVFNMVPIPPLDGSRVLYAFAPEPLQRFMSKIEPFGIFIVFGLIVGVPALGNILLNVNKFIVQLFL